MRKIVMPPTPHNQLAPDPRTSGRSWLLVAITLALGILIAGCGGNGGGGDDDATFGRTETSAACPLVVSDHALQGYYDLVDRVEAGEDVDLAAMSDLFALPAYDRWRRSFGNETPSQAWAGRMVHIALLGEETLPARLRQKSKRLDLVLAFQEALAERERIVNFANALVEDDLLCKTWEILRDWVPAEQLPDTLRIDLLAGYPEMRRFEDHVLLDAGMAWASGRGQLPGFVASLVYRDVASLEGRQPANASGEAILLETLRLVFNEVAPAHLDQITTLVFDRRHDLLAGASPSPEAIGEQATRTLRSLAGGLRGLRAREPSDDAQWQQLYRLFVGAQSWQATAWFLGEVIDDRLGRARLHEAVRHPADLFAAYHEACAVPAKDDGATPQTLAWFVANPPSLGDGNVTWLTERLRAYFE